MKSITKSSIIERLKSKPVPVKNTGIDIKLLSSKKEDIELNIKIEDKTEEYKDVAYEKLIREILNIGVKKQASKTKDATVKVQDIDVMLRNKSNVGGTYIFVRKLDNIFVKQIDSKKKKIELPNESVVKVMIEGHLIDNKKLPKPSKKNRLKLKKDDLIYHLENRETFIQFINAFFSNQYKDELKDDEENITCEKSEIKEFNLLVHQKVVRDYLNIFTPYKGLLLLHGLGSGKTCSSITIAEGLKTKKKVVVLTPKSLLRNYIEELKVCGDPLYKTNYYWNFTSIYGEKESEPGIKIDLLNQLVNELDLPESYIKENNGAWVPDSTRKSNFEKLSNVQQKTINQQINVMINNKYNFVSYNGLRKNNINFKLKTFNGSKNPFDDKVVIIDEAHNFVSRITNKLSNKDRKSVPLLLYNWLLSASNCRIVLLTGTPLINYPKELAVLYNILRGYMKQWTVKINPKVEDKVDNTYIINILKKIKINDYYVVYDILDNINYKPSTRILTFTRNPNSFINKYKKTKYMGVTFNEIYDLDDETMIKAIISGLKANKIDKNDKDIQLNKYTVFDENEENFNELFIDTKNHNLKNEQLFKKRIMGLTSYFKSPQEKLMPSYDSEKNFHLFRIPMSKYQLGIYEQARVDERKEELNNIKKRKNPLYDNETNSSTYRIFSRAYCNFVFPNTIKRPMPNENNKEDVAALETVNVIEDDEIDNLVSDRTYQTRINEALEFLKENSEEYLKQPGLEIYSPKFSKILENILNPLYKGLHLVYSNFKTLEGIGILKLVLLANGFVEFKIIKNKGGIWSVNMNEDNIGKPAFVSYTGDEDDETKEIYRNIYSNNWENIPVTIAEQLKKSSSNNIYGDIIKIFMITSSGAEGISLKNGRYVHILEPYWHPVRVEQVIGRVRRICSHQELDPKDRTVEVFMYLMTFSEEQIKDQLSTELMLKDRSLLDSKVVLTTDEYIYEKASIKEKINKNFIKNMKESAIDCNLHKSSDEKDKYTCFSYNSANINNYLYAPSIYEDEEDLVSKLNEEVVKLKAKKITLGVKEYAITDDLKLYDYDSYIRAINEPGQEPLYIGKLDKISKPPRIIYE